MGWRYRKSVTILPGVRVNFGLRSSSISFGGKGFRTTYSSTGRVTRSIGIPGTGLSYVSSSSNSQRQTQHRQHRDTGPSDARSRNLEVPDSPMIVDRHIDSVAIAEIIRNIYRTSDETVDWRSILVSDEADDSNGEWTYYKERAEKVLNGDIDTYFEIISDLNPLDDLLEYGSEFECGTDDPRMLSVHFKVNSERILRDAQTLNRREYNLLLQDYVCGCAIRIARDMFALLPLRHLIIDATDGTRNILSVDFNRTSFLDLDFETIDASDTVEKFSHEMHFDPDCGFGEIHLIDE